MYDEMSRTDAILTHMAVDDNWPYSQLLSQLTDRHFHVESMSTGNGTSRLRCLWCYVAFPLLVFLRRQRYDVILAHQQFYGLLLAFYCRLFRVRKSFRLVVLTFIYLPKAGIVGKVYHRFMRYVVQSPYIDAFTVHSTSEAELYSQLFGVDSHRFHFVPLGMNNLPPQPAMPQMSQRKYILAVGRSNRDYDFLVEALSGTSYQLEIICDNYHRDNVADNIHIHNDIFDAMPLWLQNCHCVVIPLRDPEVSSGQLVLLQALQLGKPIIATRANAVNDYITDGVSGLLIDNQTDQLLSALDSLYHDQQLYDQLSQNGKREYEQQYTAERQVENTANVINALLNSDGR